MKLMSRTQKFFVDGYRIYAIIGFETNEVCLTARYLRLFLKPYEQTLDKECKAHCISITRNLEKDDSFVLLYLVFNFFVHVFFLLLILNCISHPTTKYGV